MAGSKRTLTIDITTADAQTLAALKRIQKELRDTGQVAERTSRQGLTLGDALGGLAIGAGVSKAIGEFEEAETTLRKTEAVIRSTGNAAGVSAGQQAEMVDELSKLAAVDDEVVAGGANLLRTFTQVREEAFEPALASALDMSAALGTDLQSNILLVGKALNEPVSGMGKLAKAGVQLSEEQKELVRSLAETGDTAGAQTVILRELETQFGGQAEAAATDSAKMRVAFDDAAESLGGALAPALTVVADGAQRASSAFQGLPQPVQQAAVAAGALALVGPRIADGWTSAASAASKASGILRGSVSSFGLVKSGALGAAAGLASYAAAYEALEGATSSNTDMEGLAKDLRLIADGAIGLEPVFQSAGGSAENMAQKIRDLLGSMDESGAERFGDVLLSFQNGDPARVFGDLKEAIGEGVGHQAQQDIEDLDTALAAFAEGSPRDAKQVFGEMVNALLDQGLTLDQISGLFPRYRTEMDRAIAANRVGAGTSRDAADATDEQADATERGADAAERYADAQEARKAADEAVQDAVIGVAEAQDRVADAERSVTEAEQGVVDAQQRVADAREGVADAERAVADARRGVADAERAVVDAQEDAADAAQAVVDATADVAQAQRDAAIDSDYMADSLQGVTDAQEALTEAQESSREAQVALDEATANYGQTLAGLERDAAGAADDVLSAEIRLRKARQELAELGADGDPVSADDRLAAEIAIREAERRLEEARQRAAEAREDYQRNAENGAEGSDAVVEAHGRVEDAADDEAEAQRRLEDAVLTVASTQQEAMGRIEEAQRTLTEKIDARAAADQRVIDARQGVVDANDKVASAVRGVRDANRGVASAVDDVKDAQQRVTDAKDDVVTARDGVRKAERDVEAAVKDQYQAYKDLAALFAPGSAARVRMEWLTEQLRLQYSYLPQGRVGTDISLAALEHAAGRSSKGKGKSGPDESDHGPADDKGPTPTATQTAATTPTGPRTLPGGWVQQPNGRWYHPRQPGEENYGDGYSDHPPILGDIATFAAVGRPAAKGADATGATSVKDVTVTINAYGVDDPAATAEWIYRRAGWELSLVGVA